MSQDRTIFTLEVTPVVPPELARLQELASDLRYGWERDIRSLYASLDHPLWEESGHNPKVFMRRISSEKLRKAVNNPSYMARYSRVIAAADNYDGRKLRKELEPYLDKDQDLIAYFCAEFGLHESLPIYSGGLGILAGDHCKSASDLSLPFVAVGMLYRQGYFTQQIDQYGRQQAIHYTSFLNDLPVTKAVSESGEPLQISINMPRGELKLQIWLATVGHIRLVLLDSDLPENSEEYRDVTFRLYGGDITMRIQQEIVLGIGGVRALRALNLAPSVWHINEGHAAFMVLERCREFMRQGRDFRTAWELTASGTLFTTHTPVPAGHDIFESDLLLEYFGHWLDELKLSREELLDLGRANTELHGFNMTSLALHGSRFHNGVSAIHGGVASQNESAIWPELDPPENPISHVTNGVHASTFLAQEWQQLFDARFPDWRSELTHAEYWNRIDDISDHKFWSVRRECKGNLLRYVKKRVTRQCRRNRRSENEINSRTHWLEERGEEALVIGFARRFATYKRALLLFNDMNRLGKILENNDRPVIFVFAGKAHPADHPGQALIESIYQYSQNPAWQGKLLLVEDYDLALARKLIAGVDVWLNTPAYPMEASGTSGEKAGMNGVLNLSVMDGWWDEGYNGDNGWAIYPQHTDHSPEARDSGEADVLYSLIENEIVPLFYDRDGHGYSEEWVRRSKASMKSIVPQYCSERMVVDYVQKFYSKAAGHHRKLLADDARVAQALADWKQRIRQQWPNVVIELVACPPGSVQAGEAVTLSVRVTLGALNASDVMVECVTGSEKADGQFEVETNYSLRCENPMETGQAIYSLQLNEELHGMITYRLRAYPSHSMLGHPLEMGLMRYAIS